MFEFREELHPRGGKGSPTGGQFVSKGGSAEKTERTPRTARSSVSDGIQQPDVKALVSYTKTATDVNANLRMGVADVRAKPLDVMMRKGALSKDTVLYRDFDAAFGSQLLRMVPGDTITDKGFVSTSLKPVGKMQILAPAGAHAIAVMNHLPNQAAQEEVLLDRNSTLEYMRMTDDGVHVFKLREQQESLRNTDEVIASDVPETVYHVTQTKNVAQITRQGLKRFQTSQWKKAGTGERYGAGEIYAFENLRDAQRWAARMDWELNQQTGSGKISVVSVRSTSNQWQVDPADPISQAGGQGRWLKSQMPIKAEDILSAQKFDAAQARSLVQQNRESLRNMDKIASLKGSTGDPDLISTANITATEKKAVGDSNTTFFRPDVATMKLVPEMYEHNVGLLKDKKTYLMRPADVKGSSDQVVRSVTDHIKANMRWLYETVPSDVRDAAAGWYRGAHKLVETQATKHGVSVATVAGVYARLSPRKLWDMNIDMGNRVLDIYLTKQDMAWSDEMTAKLATFAKEERSAALVAMGGKLKGKKLSQLETSTEKAAWVRIYDEAHNSPKYPIHAPDGTVVGEKPKVAWNTLDNIAGAIEIIEAKGNRTKISEALGTKHKIRSFYNNILDPDSRNDDVTFDTHMVGAAWLRSFGGRDAPVLHSLLSGGPEGAKNAQGSALNGIKGLYPVYADATRELAKDLGIRPHELQAVVWTAKLGRMLNIKDAAAAQIDKVWKQFQTGKIELPDVHKQIDKIVPFKRPEWA